MNLSLKVLKKQRVETGKGFKYALGLGDKKGDTLTIMFDKEDELNDYEINDALLVRISRAQQQLPVSTEGEGEEAKDILGKDKGGE